ncbi:uncharacterized protein LOC110370293 [Helicoverpa armigera]|uniref:uncharacterized protein LOC110370293 n=1 Tax=Helicoverpa armigera TaxID=29058 RepID=UPI0030833234
MHNEIHLGIFHLIKAFCNKILHQKGRLSCILTFKSTPNFNFDYNMTLTSTNHLPLTKNRTMNRRFFYLLLFIINVKCEQKENTKSHTHLPYFRRKVEEIGETDFFETTETEESQNLVSFLVKNVREIFNDLVDTAETTKIKKIALKKKIPEIIPNTSIVPETTITLEPVKHKPILDIFMSEVNMNSTSISTTAQSTDMTDTTEVDENVPLTTLLEKKQESTDSNEINRRNEIMHLYKDTKFNSKPDKKERDIVGFANSRNSTEVDGELSDPRRSCIMCNNIESEDCNDPKNKLITSVMCERDDDLCYSLHTPFGIMDRGCFNVNHNLTTYVCSCNLCNYLSISEMPFMFSHKRDWVDNVIELSRTRHFRKSVFKDMSCLRCEVNTTTKTGDMLDSANCLEGNIANLPVEDCNLDEVCAVRALRADGYIWRGCIKSPLYNYWWSICDRDLCNYDTIVALYDFIL